MALPIGGYSNTFSKIAKKKSLPLPKTCISKNSANVKIHVDSKKAKSIFEPLKREVPLWTSHELEDFERIREQLPEYLEKSRMLVSPTHVYVDGCQGETDDVAYQLNNFLLWKLVERYKEKFLKK